MESKKLKKTKRKRTKSFKIGVLLLIVLIGLALTHDIIITNYLAYQLCRAEPNPKTFIKETVEFPESIYWEDNIYPGFDEKDRLLMIRNYLDGVHLKTMALNGPDGKIYVYTASEDDWQRSRDIKEGKVKGNVFEAQENDAKNISKKVKIYAPVNMPFTNYTVAYNKVELTSFQRRYLYSDEIIVTKTTGEQPIGFNRQILRLWYLILPDIEVGSRY